MRSFLLTAAAAVCLCLTNYTASAAPPRATVTGSTGGVPGDILVLDASESVADHFHWVVTPELPDGRPTILVLEEGRKCLVCSVPGTWTVVLAASNDEGVDQLKWTVTVGGEPGPGPAPPPGPDPDPEPAPGPDPEPTPPEPDLPPGIYGITHFARDQARAVNSPNRATESAAVAAGFESVAAAISAGTLTRPNLILAALLEANRAALGTEAALRAWIPCGTAIGKQLQALYQSGRLTGPEAWASVLLEVALGLRAVK